MANCLAHGRRQFVDVAVNFPDECLYVPKILKAVYTKDAPDLPGYAAEAGGSNSK